MHFRLAMLFLIHPMGSSSSVIVLRSAHSDPAEENYRSKRQQINAPKDQKDTADTAPRTSQNSQHQASTQGIPATGGYGAPQNMDASETV